MPSRSKYQQPGKAATKRASERDGTLADWMQDDESDPMPTTPPPTSSTITPNRPLTREEIRERMRQAGQPVPKNFSSGGSVSSASRRADGCAIKGKTKGRFV